MYNFAHSKVSCFQGFLAFKTWKFHRNTILEPQSRSCAYKFWVWLMYIKPWLCVPDMNHCRIHCKLLLPILKTKQATNWPKRKWQGLFTYKLISNSTIQFKIFLNWKHKILVSQMNLKSGGGSSVIKNTVFTSMTHGKEIYLKIQPPFPRHTTPQH